MTKHITASLIDGKLTWHTVVQALEDGHRLPKARIGDQFLNAGQNTVLNRAAWIEGLGFGVKTVTVMPDNVVRGLPSVQGAMLVFDDRTGELSAIIDAGVITGWKTAGDSVLGAKLLARPDSRTLLVVGAGVVAENLIKAYRDLFPDLERIEIWNRTRSRAEALARHMRNEGHACDVVDDLPGACAAADIVATATMAHEPILRGDWIRPGTHVDMIGAFKADMREADDRLLQMARLFVDSYDSTLAHIGELAIPLASGAIKATDVLSDLYGLVNGETGRQSADDITVFKNGGGAHLDLMTAHCILACLEDGQQT